MRRVNRTACAVTVLLFLVAGPASAGPPLATNDPGTPGDGNWEVNVALAMERLDSETRFEAPILDMNYGWGDHVQLKFEIPWIFLHPEGGSTKNGIGKSSLGVKWRFLNEEADGVDVSIYPQIEFTTPGSSSDDRGLVDEGTEFVIPFQGGKEFGQVGLNVELGYTLIEHLSDEWFYGLAVGYQASDRLKWVGELAGNAVSDFDESGLIANLGAIWWIADHMGFLASIGRSVYHSEGDDAELLSYIGVQLLY